MGSSYPEIAFAIIAVTIVFLLLSSSVVVYALIYQKRKKQHTHEMTTLKYIYNQELLKTQIEIQEQTFKNISQEIHDNIGQILSLVKLTLFTFPNQSDPAVSKKVNDTEHLVTKAIADLRNLSQSLHGDKIAEVGLQHAVANELKILQNTGKYETDLSVTGDVYNMDPQKEMILFRIVQESINNCVKHAEAKKITVALDYTNALFSLCIKDNGKGFDGSILNAGETGIGLKNMQNRATLIGGKLQVHSVPGNGTSVLVEIKTNP